VPEVDLTPSTTPDYRGRRRATPDPAGPPAAGSFGPPQPPPLTRRQLLELRREAERLEAERVGVQPVDEHETPAVDDPADSHEPPARRDDEPRDPAPPSNPGGSSGPGDAPSPVTRRMLAEQRQRDHSRAGVGPSKAAVALGAATVALVAVVGQRAFGSTPQASAAAELSLTASATTTADQATPRVDASVAAAALQMGKNARVPASLRAVSRSEFRPVLPGCSGKVTDFTYRNGEMPAAELCSLNFAPGHHLRADAAVALARLNIAYRAKFGHDLKLTDSYRSLASQESLAARKPGLAARPGTSEHGLGLAVDFADGVQNYDSKEYRWMRANAPTFGWQNPAWAIPPSSREEPWHWEYVVGERKGQSHADS